MSLLNEHRNIQRNGLEIAVQARDFDNPLLDEQWRSQTRDNQSPTS